MKPVTNIMPMSFLLALLAMSVQGCASDHPAVSKIAGPNKKIYDIMTIRSAESLAVVVKADQPLVYTSLQQEAPKALIIRFEDTGFDRLGPVYFPPENMAVHSIRTEQTPENGMEAQVILGLKGNLPYQLVPEGNNLKVVFTKTPPAASSASRQTRQAVPQRSQPAAAQPIGATGILKEVKIASQSGLATVYLRVDGNSKNYRAFTIDAPPPARIVVDLIGVRSAFRDEQKIPVENDIVKQVRHLGYPDKVRVVVETEKVYLDRYVLEPVEKGLILSVGTSTGKEN